jgi:enoyl-CoA hydratase
VFYEMANFAKPVVAAINGAATGCGLTVVLLSDITVMADDAWLGDGHMTMGIPAGDGVGTLWPLFTGIAKAKMYLLTGDALSAVEAERIGLVGRVVPRESLMPVAWDYARRLASGPQVAQRFIKKGINQHLKQAGIFLQDYACAMEALSAFSGERLKAPFTEYPPRLVSGGMPKNPG